MCKGSILLKYDLPRRELLEEKFPEKQFKPQHKSIFRDSSI